MSFAYLPGVGLQESLTGNQAISSSCYHTRVYSTDEPCQMTLGRGLQKGQMKKISFVHKGSDEANVNINCPNLKNATRIVMSKKGDQIELVWLGGVWAVLCTLNYENFMALSPRVE